MENIEFNNIVLHETYTNARVSLFVTSGLFTLISGFIEYNSNQHVNPGTIIFGSAAGMSLFAERLLNITDKNLIKNVRNDFRSKFSDNISSSSQP